MESAIADALVAWTARLSVACYLTWGVGAIWRRQDSVPGGRIAFGFYVAGLVWMVIHVAAAFAFVHGWSHAAAYEHTARQTANVVGLDWGGGLYFNYALVAIWAADVVWQARSRRSSARPPFAWNVFVQFYLIFMIFNATVVFGPSGWIWAACGIAGFLMATFVARFFRSKPNTNT